MTPGGRGEPEPPSDWVAGHLDLIPAGGTVVDVAAGGGRHTRLLRARGHPVVAIDIDTSRLDAGAPAASGTGPPSTATGAVADVEVVTADLEGPGPAGGWPLVGRRFAGVVVTRYLHRPLLPVLVEAVEPGGVLLYETFMVGHPALGGHPSNPDFLLQPGELVAAATAGGLAVVASQEGPVSLPRPSVVQRIAAVRPGGQWAT
ncbi:class I SAM-dependent methyltransferase [soil metagenome]